MRNLEYRNQMKYNTVISEHARVEMMTVNQDQLPGAFGQELYIQENKTSTSQSAPKWGWGVGTVLWTGPLPDASLLWCLGRVQVGQRGKFCSSVGFHGCLPIYASTVLDLFVETGCCLELLTRSNIMKGRIICGKKRISPLSFV